jgi:hypothetical protein
MMTQQLGFSILTAPLAAIDRRSLSQAWYSALHLARESAAPLRSATRNVLPGKSAPPGHRTSGRGASDPTPGTRLSGHTERREMSARGLEQERRAVPSRLVRAIERLLLDPARRVERATFAIDGLTARVHVCIQTSATGVRVIAVCAPAQRPLVVRALLQARFALARRGIALFEQVGSESA